MQVGSGFATGVITADSETFRLYNLESEVGGGACGAPDNNNNYNNNKLQLGCHPVAVVILHVYKTWNRLLINLSLEGYMRSM